METLSKIKHDYETQLKEWIDYEKASIDLINYVGKLWFEKSVELVLFRNQLIDKSSSEIMQLHLYAKDFVKKPISVKDTAQLAKAIYESSICPSRIDIGRLAYEWHLEGKDYSSYTDFIGKKLSDFINKKHTIVPRDVVLYGFGRIGRLAARDLIALAGKGEQLRLKAVVVRGNIKEELTKRADLLRNDSIHGPFPGTVIEDHENNALIINGHTVYFIAADKPDQIDYTQYGIKNALLIDNTGIFRDREKLSLHLKSKGISKVLLTAPGKGDIPNVVYGINHENLDLKNEQIFSAASCTTNAIMPILYVLDKEFKIEKGQIDMVVPR
ncbi:MAG: glyceraldehyde-3-phosphate dehydrogenase, partial [Bacteroidetes bacterium]